MKKTDFSVSLRDGVRNHLKQYARFVFQSLTASLLLFLLSWQTPVFSQSNCALFCKGGQISLGPNCTAEVTLDMIAKDTTQCVGGDFVVYIITLSGDTVLDATVTEEHINTTLIASVFDLISENSCWSYITVEDKLPPTITCSDDTISCLELLVFPGPQPSDNCSGGVQVVWLDETITPIPCDSNLIQRITRTYKAIDASGNESPTCEVNLYLERIDFDLITWPDSFVLINDTELLCDGDWADANGDGVPDPFDYYDPSTGITHPGTGVPTIDGVPIFPDFIGSCNALITYEDVVFPQIGCVTKVMRAWTAREWHCTGENQRIYIQLIEIVDNVGPVVTAPDDFNQTTTGHLCTSSVWIPPAAVSDNCSPTISVTVTYPGGFQTSNGGFFINLPVGDNIITYTAYDQCFNSSQDEMIITVQDLTPPVAVCDEHTVVALTLGGPYGLTLVDASVFDDGSYDACGPVSFRARRMTSCIEFDWTTNGGGEDDTPNGVVDSRDRGLVYRTKVPFACCDAAAGPIMIELEVTDASGNVNYCMVEVEVQDKIGPTITCPSDITISCDYPLNMDNLSAFGSIVREQADIQQWCVYDPTNPAAVNGFVCGTDGLAIDNCDVDITVTNEAFLDKCGRGYIQRVWRAADSNGSNSCVQYIYIENFHPITSESIIFPPDFLGLECALGTDPDDLEPPYDRPVIYEDHCDLVGINYTDVVFTIVEEACFKIFRTWKVIDWCRYAEYGGLVLNVNYWEHTQILKVTNQFGPEFLTDQPTIVTCNNLDCGGMSLELIQQAEDDCTPDGELHWGYAVDLNNNGTIDLGPYGGFGATINASGTYPLGYHRVIYTFEDRCGNQTVREQYLDLKSCKDPTPVCYHGLSTDLNKGQVILWATDFDAGSYHLCGTPFTLSFSPDVNDVTLVLTCEHVGQQVPVTIYATDINGNQDFCTTYVLVTDNFGFCPENGILTGTIMGNVSTEVSDNVLDVEVNLAGSALLPIHTDQTGIFTFPAMPIGQSYVVEPEKDGDYKNGVNTLDLVDIQKHLLGIRELDTPYKRIAADANNSKSITAVDLVELRKLILGVYAALPDNTSWRFVDKGYEFPDPYNPWMQPWPEKVTFDPLPHGVHRADFFAVKIGDVNNTVKANAKSLIPRGSGRTFELVVEDRTVAEGEFIEIPVYAASEETLEGMQFSFDMSGALRLMGVVAGQLDVADENFGWLQNRVLTSSWNNALGRRTATDAPLFTLVLEAAKSGRLSEQLSMTASPTTPEAYTADNEIVDVALTFRGTEDRYDFALLQNEPNPFTGLTQIGYVLPEGGEAILTLFDVTGKQLYSRTIESVKGLNKIELHKDQVGAQGMVYYQVQFQGYTATKKMLIL